MGFAAVGDTVRILHACSDLRLARGQEFVVREVDSGGWVSTPVGSVAGRINPDNYEVVLPSAKEGFRFSIVDVASGEPVFEKVYPHEYLEDAFAAFVQDVGGLELGTRLEIEEVTA